MGAELHALAINTIERWQMNETTKKKIDDIIFEARKHALETVLEPNLEEYNQVMNIILDFIKLNKRIIYGGYGWNELIKKRCNLLIESVEEFYNG